MSEEEKIAFNFYKGCNENDLKRFDDFSEVTKKQIKYTETLLNLIEKQQKEIEEYRKLRADIIKVNKKIYDVDIIEDMCEQLANSISKDKIRKKIEELEKYVNDFEEYWNKDPRQFKKEKCIDYYKLEALKELLGE